MSKYAYGLRTSRDGRKTKCCTCCNPIKKGEQYMLFLFGDEVREYHYCEYCWNDVAYCYELPSWDEVLKKIEKAKKQKEMT